MEKSGKKREEVTHLTLLFLLLFSLGITATFYAAYFGKEAPLTGYGYAPAQGGYVTELNLDIPDHPVNNWASLYGELTEDSSANTSTQVTVIQGNVTERNISVQCLGDEVYASNGTISDFNTITAGIPVIISDFLQIQEPHAESAARMFTTTQNYIVGDNNLSVPGTHTVVNNSDNQTFDLGLLNNSGNVVMVTHRVTNKVGFDGRTHDYQILVPAKETTTLYYLSTDCSTLGCGALSAYRNFSETLSAKIDMNQDCFTFSNDSSGLNCFGFYFYGNMSGTAINISHRFNITIEDCVITNFSTANAVINSTLVKFKNVTVNATSLYLDSELVNSTIITLNSRFVTNRSSFYNSTFEINDSSKVSFEHSFITNTIITINGNTSSNTSFFLNVSASNATITLDNSILENVSFENNTNTIATSALLRIVDAALGPFTFTSVNLSLFRRNSGELNFSVPITVTSTLNLSRIIIIKNDSISVNSSAVSQLNTSAKLTFFPQNLTDLEAKIDPEDDGTFVACPSTICQNASTVSDTFKFDVTQFSSYSYGASSAAAGVGGGTAGGGGGGGGGGSGGGARPKDLEVAPDSIEKVLSAEKSQQFAIELRNGLQKREVSVGLSGPDFMYLDDHQQHVSLTLNPNEVAHVILTVVMPKNPSATYTATITVKGVNYEKSIPITIYSGISGFVFKTPVQEQPQRIQEHKDGITGTMSRFVPKNLAKNYLFVVEYTTSYKNEILLGIASILLIITLLFVHHYSAKKHG